MSIDEQQVRVLATDRYLLPLEERSSGQRHVVIRKTRVNTELFKTLKLPAYIACIELDCVY